MRIREDGAIGVPAFRLYLAARAVSWTGNAITLVALPILIYQLTASPALSGLLATLEALPYLVLGLPAGALADRWNRKRVLVVTGVASGGALATVPLASALGMLTVGHVFVVATVVPALFVFADAAGFGALPELVGRDRIPSATGSMVAVGTFTGVIGPAIGGVVASASGAASALAIDAVAYLVAAGLTLAVRWPRVAPSVAPPLTSRQLAADIREGLRFIWDTRIVRWLTLIGAGASVSAGALTGLIVVVAVRNLGMSSSDARLGFLYTATAVGAFLMSLVAGRIQREVPTGWITILALGVTWLAQIAWALTTSIVIGLAVLAVFQAAATLVVMNGIIVRQSLAPDHLQGRVNTTARMIAWGGTPLGALAGGLLAEQLAVGPALLICSAGTGAGLVIALSARLWRVPTLATLRAAESDGR